MALFHLSVTQTKRSAGQSAIASAAYRAGERLYSEYYGEYSDYTRKGGVICSDILLPSHAPPEYADRQTLWNAVEKAERGKNAQLAYSFDIALQNEFSLEENIALARQFLLENFVSRGMVVDFAVHQPDREDGGIPNPHFHVLCPILSLFEQLVGAGNLSAKEKSILDRCTADVYRDYMRGGYKGQVPTLKDLYRQLMLQPEEEARGLALSSELFINGSLNTFAQETNVNTKSRIIDYDIRELGEQLMPLGMLVTLDSIFNRVIQNWKKGKTTWIFADEFYLLFRYEYSADFFYRLYKRIRKYSGFVTGLTQNVEELLKSDTARLMLANSEFLILLNQATTDRDELAALLNISDNQLSYITNVGAGHGLIRCSGNLVPFENSFPRNTKLYRLMTTKPGEA